MAYETLRVEIVHSTSAKHLSGVLSKILWSLLDKHER